MSLLWLRFKRRLLRRAALARRHRVVGELWGLVDGVLGDAVRDHTLIYAAAVAFFTLLSLIPLLILFASAGGFVLHYMGGGDPADVEQLISEVLIQLHRAIPFMGERLETDLRLIVANRGGLGFVGFFALLLSASQVFRALEFSFARIFARGRSGRVVEDHLVKPRSLVLSKLLFAVFLLSLIGIFLVFRVALRILSRLTAGLPDPLAAIFADPLSGDSVAGHLISGALVVFGFWALIQFFSPHRIHPRFSLFGGAIFAAVWQLSRVIFELYLTRWAQLGALYGSFSALMASVLWIFFSAVLLLLCAHLVWALERRFRYGARFVKKRSVIPTTLLPMPAEDLDEPPPR